VVLAKSYNPTLPSPRHKFPELSTNRNPTKTAAQLWLLLNVAGGTS